VPRRSAPIHPRSAILLPASPAEDAGFCQGWLLRDSLRLLLDDTGVGPGWTVHAACPRSVVTHMRLRSPALRPGPGVYTFVQENIDRELALLCIRARLLQSCRGGLKPAASKDEDQSRFGSGIEPGDTISPVAPLASAHTGRYIHMKEPDPAQSGCSASRAIPMWENCGKRSRRLKNRQESTESTLNTK
jgi:hypothetical protein